MVCEDTSHLLYTLHLLYTCLRACLGALSFWTFVEVPVAFLLVGKMKLSYERWWERQHVESGARGWGARPEQLINNTRRTSVRKSWYLCGLQSTELGRRVRGTT